MALYQSARWNGKHSADKERMREEEMSVNMNAPFAGGLDTQKVNRALTCM
jgi:hypothetical protein